MTCTRPRRNETPSEHFLQTSHCALHIPGFTLQTCASHSTLHPISNNNVNSSHLIWPHLSSSHLIPSLLTCHLSKFFSTVFISSEHWSTFLVSSKFFSTHLSCSAKESSYCHREVYCTKKHWAQKAFAHRSLGHRCIYTAKPLQNTLYYKACTKHFSQYYFVLQSLHKVLPNTTLYYKACANYFPVLLSTTKLAQSTSLYYFVLQSPHVSTHMATEHDNNHAAITQRSATRGSTNA